MLLKHLLTASCISLVISANGYATELAKTTDDTIITVNSVTITQQDYDTYVNNMQTNQAHADPSNRSIHNELIQRELIRQDAMNKGLDKIPDFIQKTKYFQNNLLIAVGIRNYLTENSISDAELREEYDEQIAQIEVPNEYKVRHILVKEEIQAQAIITNLGDGKDFGELVQ